MIGLVILYSLLTNIAALLIPTPTPPACLRDGKIYGGGQHYQPSPCEFCECVHGHEQCMFADCPAPCVNPIHQPNQCCPICRNGLNCYAGDKIIPAFTDVQIDEYTTCRCPVHFGFTADRAECRVSATTKPPRN